MKIYIIVCTDSDGEKSVVSYWDHHGENKQIYYHEDHARIEFDDYADNCLDEGESVQLHTFEV